MRNRPVDQVASPRRKPYVPPKLVQLGSVEQVPSVKMVFEEEKAKREMRKAQTKNLKIAN